MAIQIKSLKQGTLPTSEGDLYVVPLNKAAIVKTIRLVNTGTGAVTVNLFIQRGASGTHFRVAPKDLSLSAGTLYIDDVELTLEGLATTGGEDRIRGIVSSGGTVDCVISGVERDI